MKARYTMEPRENEEVQVGPISKQLRICVACGNTHVEEYRYRRGCPRVLSAKIKYQVFP